MNIIQQTHSYKTKEYKRWKKGHQVAIEIIESGRTEVIGFFGIYNFGSAEDAENFLLTQNYTKAGY